MSRKRGGGQGREPASWLQLQTMLAPYEAGVHWLEVPATDATLAAAAERLGPLPAALVELYRRFGGARLFLDSHELLVPSEIERVGPWLRVGQSLGAAVFCSGDGAIRLEDEEGETMLAATTPLGWLCLLARREQLVFDKDGEFRDVFDEESEGELAPAIRRKRAELGLHHEPRAALYPFELALLALDEGDEPEALEQGEAARRLDPLATAAHELVGSLLERQDAAAASAAWAEAGRTAERAARAADALAWAVVLGGPLHPDATARAELALGREPGCVLRWLTEAEQQLGRRESEAAQRLAKLAAAVARTEDDKRRATQLLLRGSLRAV